MCGTVMNDPSLGLHIFLESQIFSFMNLHVFCRTQLNLKEPQLGQDDEMNQFEEVKLWYNPALLCESIVGKVAIILSV